MIELSTLLPVKEYIVDEDGFLYCTYSLVEYGIKAHRKVMYDLPNEIISIFASSFLLTAPNNGILFCYESLDGKMFDVFIPHDEIDRQLASLLAKRQESYYALVHWISVSRKLLRESESMETVAIVDSLYHDRRLSNEVFLSYQQNNALPLFMGEKKSGVYASFSQLICSIMLDSSRENQNKWKEVIATAFSQ